MNNLEILAKALEYMVQYAKGIARDILAHNGERIDYEGRKIPLENYCAVLRLGEKTMRYSELFTSLQTALTEAKW